MARRQALTIFWDGATRRDVLEPKGLTSRRSAAHFVDLTLPRGSRRKLGPREIVELPGGGGFYDDSTGAIVSYDPVASQPYQQENQIYQTIEEGVVQDAAPVVYNNEVYETSQDFAESYGYEDIQQVYEVQTYNEPIPVQTTPIPVQTTQPGSVLFAGEVTNRAPISATATFTMFAMVNGTRVRSVDVPVPLAPGARATFSVQVPLYLTDPKGSVTAQVDGRDPNGRVFGSVASTVLGAIM